MSKIPNWKWGDKNEKTFEHQSQQLIDRLCSYWNIPIHQLKLLPSLPLSEISDKQKKTLQDIFANMPYKRIFFQYETRLKYSVGRNFIKWENQLSDIKLADFVLHPINANEIQQILVQAQQNDIEIQCFSKESIQPIFKSTNNKMYAVISLEEMNRIIHLDKRNKQISLQNGIKVINVQKYLNDNGYELKYDIRGYEYLNIAELIKLQPLFKSSITQLNIATSIGLISANKENGLLDLFLQKSTLGIPYEITLSVRPLAKSTRRIDAWFPHLKSVENFLLALQQNHIHQSKTLIYCNKSKQIFKEKLVEQNEPASDFFNTLLRKPEEIFFKDDTPRPIALSLEFNEYQYSISSILIRAKEILQENQGKIELQNLSQDIESLSEEYPYYQDNLTGYGIDCFHLSANIPFDKIDDYQKEINKKLDKPLFYKNNAVEYHVQFSEYHFPNIKIDLYFFASKNNRKSFDAFGKTYTYFQEFFKQIPQSSTNELFATEKLINIFGSQLDAKKVII
ncbi:MAG: FAD-binding protein [Chitinophagales bacterium]|nr:FAD-binding protein [Chitinophagales bacterium]